MGSYLKYIIFEYNFELTPWFAHAMLTCVYEEF